MKILHTVEFYSPSTGGAQEVVKQISEHLVKKGHDVTVVTSKLNRENNIINGVKIREFEISGNFVKGYSGDVQSYINFVIDSEYDIILNYAAQQWTTDAILPYLHKIKGKKILVPCGYSGLYNDDYSEYFEKLKEWLPQYDCTIYLSNNYRDINLAKEIGLKNISVIPNGAGEEEFEKPSYIDIRQKLNIPKNTFLILTLGSHTGVKGHYESIKIFNKARINNAYFAIVGNYVKGGCYKRCIIQQFFSNIHPMNILFHKKILLPTISRTETVELLKQSDLFLFPSNIECSPIVLFEAMASSTPFMITDVGNAKEIIDWSGGGLLLPTEIGLDGYSYAKIAESARILEEIYNNAKERLKLSKSGYHAWKENFTWEKISERYEEIYKNLCTQHE